MVFNDLREFIEKARELAKNGQVNFRETKNGWTVEIKEAQHLNINPPKDSINLYKLVGSPILSVRGHLPAFTSESEVEALLK